MPVLQPMADIASSGVSRMAQTHPLYRRRNKWWEFLRISYEGGQSYLEPVTYSVEFTEPLFARNSDGTLTTIASQQQQLELSVTSFRSMLHRHSREKAWEYFNRNRRARYFNIVKPVVNSLVSHAMKAGIVRDGPPELEAFWDQVDEHRTQSMDSFMSDVLRRANTMGICWVCVDVDAPGEDDDSDGKPYAYMVSPQDVVDWQADDDGNIEWLKQYVATEVKRTWDEPFKEQGRYRIWTKTEMLEYSVQIVDRGGILVPMGEKLESRRPITIGRVPWEPVFAQADGESDFPFGVSLVGDLAKVANSVFNHCSLADEIAYKQTFSWLVIPDPTKSLDATQIGTNTAFGYNPGGTGGKPEYISPDADQLRVLMELIGSELEQARSTFGLGKGRSESSKQQASADALELESDDKKALLADVARQGQDAEQRIARLVMAYSTKGRPELDDVRIVYPRDFDVRSFKADIDEALAFQKLTPPPPVNAQLLSDLVRRRWGDSLPQDELDALLKAIEDKQTKDQEASDKMHEVTLAGQPMGGGDMEGLDKTRGNPQGASKRQPGPPKPGEGNGA